MCDNYGIKAKPTTSHKHSVHNQMQSLSEYTNLQLSMPCLDSQVVLKLSKPQISQKHPSRIFFIIPGWHITCNLNLLSLTMGTWANLNVSSNKCVKILAIKPNQLQVTTYHPQANAIIERVHKVVSCQLHAQII
jgi:hypothetical protein